ncbi:MAG TPA: CHAT domain-containing protein [Acetobacteraceae bacterium]|nr:CHAT domain-containing protein [Acetobacteraceae bacterium]
MALLSLQPAEFRITVENMDVAIGTWRSKPETESISLDPITRQTIETFNRWLDQGGIKRRDELELLGSYLYRALFRGKIHDQFVEAFKAAGKTRTLRVVLVFSRAAQELASWPWEYLYRPDDDKTGKGCFIAAENSLILTRHVTVESPGPWVEADDEIRILAVHSHAKGADKVSEETLNILDELKTRFDGKVKVEQLRQPTKHELEKKLSTFKPQIVHFIGHGQFDGGKGKICFVDPKTGGDDWVEDETFADSFADHTPQLVFLQACEGAGNDPHKAFSGVALLLVFNRVPVVVAMRYQIANTVADAFVKTFYAELSANRPIDEAVQIGRRELGKFLDRTNFASRNFGCPVIYLQSFDAEEQPVLRFPAQSAPGADAEAEPPRTPKRYCCPNPLCGKPVNPDRKFCQSCRLEYRRCPSCDSTYSVTAGFCDACGWPQVSERQAEAAQPAPPQSNLAAGAPAPPAMSGLALVLSQSPGTSGRALPLVAGDAVSGGTKLWQ